MCKGVGTEPRGVSPDPVPPPSHPDLREHASDHALVRVPVPQVPVEVGPDDPIEVTHQ